MTERTENIIGAVIGAALVIFVLVMAGWAIPNYYVYYMKTVSKASVFDCRAAD